MGSDRMTILSRAVVLALLLQTGSAMAQDLGDAGRGLEYAKRTCASCHAIGPDDGPSPVDKATPFRIVANTPGMTGRALMVWLTTPHPTMPNLVIAENDRRDVIAYILTLHEK
jgi:mono/diheme cytochrome c family protein